MKILLIYPDIIPTVKNFRGYIQIGLSSIAASLIEAGHEVKLLHIKEIPDKNTVISSVQGFNPSIVGFSSTTNQFETSRKIAGWIRLAAPESKIVVGGIHAILNADQIVNHEEFDLICRGEGEFPMVHLAEKLSNGQDWHDTPSMWIRLKDGNIRKNAMLPVITDLDALPFPSREIWDYSSLHMESQGIASVMFSRGCPRECTYCCNHAISKIYLEGGEKKYFRLRSVDSTIAELLWLKKKYPFITSFTFEDDNLFLNLKWAKEFTERYSTEIGLPFSCNIYPTQVDSDRVELLKKAGCTDVRIGLESGNEYIRTKILGRKTSDEIIRNGYRLCRNAGINTRSFIIIGLPFETVEMLLDSIKFIADENVGIAQYSIFYPYRKTILYDLCVENDFLDKSASGESDYFSKCILNMKTLSVGQIEMFRNYFPFFVLCYRQSNKFPGPLRGITRRIIDILLKNTYLHHVLNRLALLIPTAKKIIPLQLKYFLFKRSGKVCN